MHRGRIPLAATVVAVAAAWVPARADEPKSADAPDVAAAYRNFDELVAFLRKRAAEQYRIPAQGIDEAAYVNVGGIEQWVTIRGYDRKNPVILFVHGGPGDVTSMWTFALFAPWEKQFTVVQWDQRGAGRTLRKNGPASADGLTIGRLADDGIALSEYLCKHLGKDKIIVVAHSFGTIIALRMARARPDLFYAYVGTGQAGDSTRNYHVAYQALVAKARAAGNA